MTTTDDALARLRTDLTRAARADLRRARRRRRAMRLAAVPMTLLALSGTALALGPLLGDPAPPAVQQQFDRDRGQVHDPAVPGPGTPLFEVARADGRVMYAGEGPGGWCVAIGTGAWIDRPTDGFACVPNERPGEGEIALIRVGGGSERWMNVAAGRVGADATSVEIALVTGERVTGPVSAAGYFIVALPDSVLTTSPKPGDRAPVVGATAHDAQGRVVARHDESG